MVADPAPAGVGRNIRSASWHVLGMAIVLAAGAALRFAGIRDQIILDDEWHALNMVQHGGYADIFTRFGHADHSVPMSLLFEWLSRHGGLGEMVMRAPSLLAGLALIVLFPWLLRSWLGRPERLLTAGLLAVSPLLVFYSRLARPYAVLALLVSTAIVLAWRWWRGDGRRFGVGWWLCAVLAGWMNPVTLALTLAPFAWFGIDGLRRGVQGRGWQALGRACLLGGLGLAAVGALLATPLVNDWQSLAVKSGRHYAGLETAAAFLVLYAGSAHAAVVAGVSALALGGWLVLRTRDGGFARYLAVVAVLAAGAVLASGAEWVHQAIVPARYLIGLLPFFLGGAAVGAWWLLRRLVPAGLVTAGLATGMVLLLLATGPIGGWQLRQSAFAHHAANHFDYRPWRNPYIEVFDDYTVPGFYAEIAQDHPNGDALVIEAPWHLESFWNTFHLNQQVHGQRVRVGFVSGLCAEQVKGEIDPDVAGMHFRNFVRLSELLEGEAEGDYLVLHRRGVPGSRIHRYDVDACADAARAAFGPPWRETGDALVFRIPVGAGTAATPR